MIKNATELRRRGNGCRSMLELERSPWRIDVSIIYGLCTFSNTTYNRVVKEAWTVILEPAEEGGWVAKIAEFPGAISEGESQEEAREMVLEALDELIELHRERALAAKSRSAVVLAA